MCNNYNSLTITNNQWKTKMCHWRFFQSPPQWGHQKWSHETGDESKRTIGLSRDLCTLTNPGGVSHFMNQLGEAPPCFLDNKETISLAVGVSHVRWNPLNAQAAYHNTKTINMVNVPNSQRLKIIATYVSAKLTGLRARGCGGFTTLQSTQTQTT